MLLLLHTPDRLVAPLDVAGAVIGWSLGGPILAVIAGFCFVYAVQKEGPTRDIAQSMREVALSAKQKTDKLEETQRLIERSKKGVDSTESKIVRKVRR
jgi:hypothetical protein